MILYHITVGRRESYVLYSYLARSQKHNVQWKKCELKWDLKLNTVCVKNTAKSTIFFIHKKQVRRRTLNSHVWVPSGMDYSQMQINMSQHLKTKTKSTTLLVTVSPSSYNWISLFPIRRIKWVVFNYSFNLIPHPHQILFLLFPFVPWTDGTELIRLSVEHATSLTCAIETPL